MSADEAWTDEKIPGQEIYGENHSGLRWQIVAITILSWATTIVGFVVSNNPKLGALTVVPLVGGFFALIYTCVLVMLPAVGLRVYEDSLQIGGMRGRERRLLRGKWPPQNFNVGLRRKAVFICPWQAIDGLFLLTEEEDIKRLREERKQYSRDDLREWRLTRRDWKSTRRVKVPLGVFNETMAFAKAVLVISHDPDRTWSEPREFDNLYTRGPIYIPVRSPVWMVPIRDPDAFWVAVHSLPQAPKVYARLPDGHVRFEIS